MNTYYYVIEETQKFSFYRLPKALCLKQEFKNLSSDAKLLYTLLLDRMALSIKNNWVDKDNHVYVIYKVEKASYMLHCSLRKGKDLFAELEKFGLIQRKKQGFGKPYLIYIMEFLQNDNAEQNTNLKYDYYSLEDAKKFSFYRIPQVLFENDFQSISTNAKLLFSILLDRLQLSFNHHWKDNENHTYIQMTVEEVSELFGCCEKTSRKLFAELVKAKLIYREKQGLGKPTAIYIMDFIGQASISPALEKEPDIAMPYIHDERETVFDIEPENKKSCHFKALYTANGKICTYGEEKSAPRNWKNLHHDTGNTCTHGEVKSAFSERYFLHPNNTKHNHTNSSYTDIRNTDLQQQVSNDVVVALRAFIPEILTDAQCELLYSAAKGDIALIQEKYAIMQKHNVHNVMGFLLAAIKKNYQPPQKYNKFEYLQGVKYSLQQKVNTDKLNEQYPQFMLKIDEFLTLLTNILGSDEEFPVIDEHLYFKKKAIEIEQQLNYDFIESLLISSFHKDINSIFMDCLDCLNKCF